MTGINLFHEEAKKRQLNIGSTDTSSGDKNGNFTITDIHGKSTVQNYKSLANVYGTLTFWHYSPEEAMSQVFELIETQMNIDYEQKHGKEIGS